MSSPMRLRLISPSGDVFRSFHGNTGNFHILEIMSRVVCRTPASHSVVVIASPESSVSGKIPQIAMQDTAAGMSMPTRGTASRFVSRK